MDNMLYIVAGLVIILLIAILVLRRNKAKQSLSPTPLRTHKQTARSVSSDRMPQPSVNRATKFDDITIAQRFVDQQRYDKAIEALERGLKRKPYDEQLSLKLLSIYTTTNELSEFNRVYGELVQNNPQAIPKANELKSLLSQDQATSVSALASSFDQSSVGSMDFDLPQSSVQFDGATSAHEPIGSLGELDLAHFDTADSSYAEDTISNTSMASDDIFELTLDDLEDNDIDTQESSLDGSSTETISTETNSTQSVHDIDNTQLENLDLSGLDLDTGFDLSDKASTASSVNEPLLTTINDNDSFFDFDQPIETDSKSIDTHNRDSQSDSLVLNELSVEGIDDDNALDEDFVLDPADLETNTNYKTLATYAPSNSLALSLDDDDKTQGSTTVASDNAAQDADQTDVSMLFDDQSPIKYSSDFEDTLTPIESAPVSDDSKPATDLTARFAADFGFVKTLDTNQVTLNLATQYVRLGEYDSAKRLLNEVIAQGNSEQKQQAQTMLERTA